MTSERWQRVKSLLHPALEREGTERACYLDEVCAGDPALRSELDSLIDSYDRAGTLFEMPAVEATAQVLVADAGSLAGRTTGPYTILSQLGAGGMGVVYLAHDSRLGRKVALKVLHSWLTDADRVGRFQLEASAASQLNHPNILTIYEVGTLDAGHFIATEYIDGLTLRSVIAQKSMSISEALDAALQAASALSAAHAAGIVHRDIKPENLMMRRDGYLKVLDFGIAKLSPKAGSEESARVPVHTEPGTVMGTITYMSPEQARGIAVTASTDIWSLGVVLYEMVTGTPPFEGTTVADMIVAILEREPAPLSRHRNGVPAELERIVRKALERDPKRRYESIDHFSADLKRLRQSLDTAQAHEFLADRTAPTAQYRRKETAANNLSGRLPALIGRESELTEIKTLLHDPGTRLVTLTGPGGTGKTRLSQQVARDLLDEFYDGVFLVALAPVRHPDMIAATIAQVVGVQETRERAFAEGLRDYLRDKNMLLLLDNFEHVIEGAPLISDLLDACSRLKILVTSRAALHLGDEREFKVQPLALPQLDDVRTAAGLMQCASAVLLVQRLSEVSPQFKVTNENARTVAEICVRLDGLPLALELAAARTKLLSLDDLLARMSHRLSLLKGRARDLPERQKTMRAAIAWSFDLLGEDEKALCRRLAVFAGGCTLESAEAVCDGIGRLQEDVLDALDTLVDENLVLKKQMDDGSYRFLMLETIREFGLEHLEASGELDAARRSHASYFCMLAEKAEPHLMSAGRDPWLQRLDAEHNNLRAALQWAADRGEVETGLRLAGALRWFWYFRGHFGEGYHWATQLLAMTTAPASREARAKALLCAGSLAFYYSDPVAAAPLLEESVAGWRALGDERQLAYTLVFASLAISLGRRDFALARDSVEEGVALFRKMDERWGLALALTYAGVILWTHPDFLKEAAARFEESAAIFETLGDGWGVSGPILYLGVILQDRGDLAGARSIYERFVELSRKSRDVWRLASGLDFLADLLRLEGETGRADELAEESRTFQSKLGRSLNLRKALNRMRTPQQGAG